MVLFMDDVSITEIKAMSFHQLRFWSQISRQKIELKYKSKTWL